MPGRASQQWQADVRGPVQRRGLGPGLRRLLGLRASLVFQGVRYRECSTGSLRHALSKRGSGHKDYDVTFRNGSHMRIRCTRERAFADLVHPPTLPVLLRVERLLRPGMRALVYPSGTGLGAAMIAGRVAPSGSVVAIEGDAQSVEFARNRYPIQNVSYECGGIGELRGEVDGAFDAAVVVYPDDTGPAEGDLAELWRIIAPGGWLLCAHAAGGNGVSGLNELMGRVCRDEAAAHPESTSHIGPLGDGRDGWIAAVAHRPSRE